MDPDAFQFVLEHAGVRYRHEVGVFTFDVSPQRLDPGLVGGAERRPKCWAIEHRAMNRRVSVAFISVPLSDIANSNGRPSSSSPGSASRSLSRQASSSVRSPSASRARVNSTLAATDVGSGVRVTVIHLRDTRSMIPDAYLAVTQASNWDISQHHNWLGRHSHQSGHGVFIERPGRLSPAKTRPLRARTRSTVDGDTQTRFS